MEFIVENWYVIVTGIVFIVGGVMAVLRLQAVLGAEREFGSGTGKLKLSSVYDKFCERFPWLAKVLPFETFSKYVDDALSEMKDVLKQNSAIASIVEPKEGEK